MSARISIILMWAVFASISFFKTWFFAEDIYTIQQLFGQIIMILVLGISAIYYKLDELCEKLK